MRKILLALPLLVLALVGIGLAGCETKSDDKRHKYPSADESVRPNSDIPQMGTDGFVKDD
ncbi:MAG TPA: hypothetical protein VLN73_01940 [Alphaproteobacteria bacterium]|nr:hypothetical protein [Alphaproteobacteria bacterium]